ncbi:sigma-70 family RNA polymerase sigma factor [Amycolatopsis sp. NPDC058986]|uniref:sigma-70 family RNA polymerase sigma factor n=1 Tax=unclassified Amycolatopsis TaxID=2618356 RepID=UPI00366E5374
MSSILSSDGNTTTVVPSRHAAVRRTAGQRHHRRASTSPSCPTAPTAEEPSDAELITAVRAGELRPYGTLYSRHRNAANNLARQLARSATEADDLVSEAFAKMLDILRDGRGPDSAFRAYLLTTLRHIAYDKTQRARRIELTEDVETTALAAASPEKISERFPDTAITGLEHSIAARAFAHLPERWQKVLWHTEIEGLTPAATAPLLGLTPNGVSALSYRAREGLRQAYLQMFVAAPESRPPNCRRAAAKFGAWARGGLSKREAAPINTHLDGCSACRAVIAELHHELPA